MILTSAPKVDTTPVDLFTVSDCRVCFASSLFDHATTTVAVPPDSDKNAMSELFAPLVMVSSVAGSVTAQVELFIASMVTNSSTCDSSEYETTTCSLSITSIDGRVGSPAPKTRRVDSAVISPVVVFSEKTCAARPPFPSFRHTFRTCVLSSNFAAL